MMALFSNISSIVRATGSKDGYCGKFHKIDQDKFMEQIFVKIQYACFETYQSRGEIYRLSDLDLILDDQGCEE